MKSTARPPSTGIKRGMTTPQVLLLVVAGLVIAFFGFRQFNRVFASEKVVVARESISGGQPIAEDQLKTRRVSKREVPPDAIRNAEQIIGRTLATNVEKGAVMRAANFARPRNAPQLRDMIPEGRVLYGLNVSNQTLPMAGLRQGDSLDVIVAGPSTEDARTRIANILVRDAQMVGYMSTGGQGGAADNGSSSLGAAIAEATASPDDDEEKNTVMMLAVLPEDVVALAEADGAGLHLAVVLHGLTEEGDERLRLTNRERIQVIQGAASKHVPLP